jgi:predicted RND superfamily exporter protein
VERTRQRLARLPAGLQGHVTGNAVLLTRAADDISRGQVRSLSAAVVVILLILVAAFRSWRLGLVALVPNALPVVLYFGLLGASGVGLTNATALMGCIVLGIAVDDTLHLLVHYRREAACTGSRREGMAAALVAVARPVTHTSAVLCLGLLLLSRSELASQAVDLTVTPALCAWIGAAPRRPASDPRTRPVLGARVPDPS